MHARTLIYTINHKKKGRVCSGCIRPWTEYNCVYALPHSLCLSLTPSSLPPSPLPEDKLCGSQAFCQSPKPQKGAHCLYSCSLSAKKKCLYTPMHCIHSHLSAAQLLHFPPQKAPTSPFLRRFRNKLLCPRVEFSQRTWVLTAMVFSRGEEDYCMYVLRWIKTFDANERPAIGAFLELVSES